MDKMFKVFESELKAIDVESRTITALISTATKDRMGEVLLPGGADIRQFNKNPVVLFAHNYSEPPIGRALWTKKTKEGILSKVEFAKTQFAEEIFQLYKDGFMRAFSVGFIPKKWDDGEIAGKDCDNDKKPRRTYTEWEMVEYSAVPVPANPDALALALQKGMIKSEVLKKEFNIVEEVVEEKKAEEEVKAKENVNYFALVS